MTQSEFADFIKRVFEDNGYTKVKVRTALFSKKADVVAVDPKKKKREFEVRLVFKKGKNCLQVTPKNDYDWIDRIAEFEAFMED